MKNKRYYFRPWVQTMLEAMVILVAMSIFMVNDIYDFVGYLKMMAGAISIIVVIVLLLSKWGRY